MVARGVRSRALRAHPSYRLCSALVRYDDHRQRKIGSIAPCRRWGLEDLKQRDQQLEPVRGLGARKRAARFKREIEFDRRRAAQIQSTNHRHNYG
jgi:hypothetical protein